ncbi:MAG: sigma-70 family RNA polymerase sigma factor [Opitutus sp.]
MASTPEPTASDKEPRGFVTTRWSAVLQMRGAASDESRNALQQLCRAYWYPLYWFSRRRGLRPHDAEDLIQSFFAHLLEKEVFARADRERGRFRTFLLSALKNFEFNERARSNTLKRGGREEFVSIDDFQAESRYEQEPSSDLSPERLYDQKWAASLLAHVLETLRLEYAASGKPAMFEELRHLLWGGRGPTSYETIAARLGTTEGAIKVAVHRFRARFKEQLHHEVAQTVEDPSAIEDELRHLLASLTT